MLTTLPVGIYFARTHQVKKHKTCMVLCIASLLLNPMQRFSWVIYSKVVSRKGHGCDNGPG
jgi:hypothetical protein